MRAGADTTAAIRARLDVLEFTRCCQTGALVEFDALRAVLEECDYAPSTPTAQRLAAGIRHRIATALGVDDE